MSNRIRHASVRTIAAAVVGLALAASASVPGMAQMGSETECDRLAQPPRLTMGHLPALSEGVTYGSLRGAAALDACKQAMAEQPGETRFVAYAARAADKTGDSREAMRLYRLAAEKGNALAQNNLGAIYEAGRGILPRNEREAQRQYTLAAEQEVSSGYERGSDPVCEVMVRPTAYGLGGQRGGA